MVPLRTLGEERQEGHRRAQTEAAGGQSGSGEGNVITIWTSNELHNQMFEFGEKVYNEKHADSPVELKIEVYPNAGDGQQTADSPAVRRGRP